MRWLCRSTLLTVALCISSMANTNVEATCVTGTTATGTPDTDALTMFVTSSSASNGNFRGSLAPKGLTGAVGGTGIDAADQLCTWYASQSNFAKGSFNRNAGGGTVQFTALISTVGINAIDRFSSVSTKNIINANGDCLAANILDLFTGSGGTGYNLETIKTENNGAPNQNQKVWTGTGKFISGSPSTSYADNYGYTFHGVGQTGTFSATAFQCNNWGATSGSGVSGILAATTGGNGANRWLQQLDADTGDVCSSGDSLYCISAQPFQAPTQPPGGNGDPQFTGLQGQQFQVHGMPEEFFNLITTPTFQLNSRFTYLASGQCNYNNTECWTHPGTYVDQLGFMFPGIQIKTIAGSHRKGLRVWINEEEMKKSSGKVVMSTTTGVSNSTVVGEISVSHPHHDVLIVSSPLFTIEVTNSDWFFNFNLMFHSPEILDAGREMHYIADARSSSSATHARHFQTQVYPTYPMHGLVGQTWKNARYPAKRMYQGEVDDYMLLDHTLFSTQFMFNLYAY